MTEFSQPYCWKIVSRGPTAPVTKGQCKICRDHCQQAAVYALDYIKNMHIANANKPRTLH